MRKIYKSLTKDQKDRGVIFSSTLSNSTTEMNNDTVHEVFRDDRNGNRIDYLKDISFFKNGSPWKYCIERQ